MTMEWLRDKLSFDVLRSALLCVRGSKKELGIKMMRYKDLSRLQA